MSFGKTKEILTKSLQKIRKSICLYQGPYCDCKFLGEDSKLGESEFSGCPELYEVEALLNVMTPEEFKDLCNRAAIRVWEVKEEVKGDDEQ